MHRFIRSFYAIFTLLLCYSELMPVESVEMNEGVKDTHSH